MMMRKLMQALVAAVVIMGPALTAQAQPQVAPIRDIVEYSLEHVGFDVKAQAVLLVGREQILEGDLPSAERKILKKALKTLKRRLKDDLEPRVALAEQEGLMSAETINAFCDDIHTRALAAVQSFDEEFARANFDETFCRDFAQIHDLFVELADEAVKRCRRAFLARLRG